MAHDKPFWETDSGKPIFATGSGKPVFGNPENCPCCSQYDPTSEHPCSDCGGAQDEVTVSIDCSGRCHWPAGTYTFDSFTVLTEYLCGWRWVNDRTEEGYGKWELNLFYDATVPGWSASIYEVDDGDLYYHNPWGDWICNRRTNKLEGVLMMAGVFVPGAWDCTGCTATVTF